MVEKNLSKLLISLIGENLLIKDQKLLVELYCTCRPELGIKWHNKYKNQIFKSKLFSSSTRELTHDIYITSIYSNKYIANSIMYK